MNKGAGTKDLNRAMPGPAHLGRKQKGRFGFMPRCKRKGVAKARNPLIWLVGRVGLEPTTKGL